MGTEAREKWVTATLLLHFSPQYATILPIRLREAVTLFAGAIEIELNSRLFSTFREVVSRNVHLRSLAEQGLENREFASFCQFLVRGRPLTMGAMLGYIRSGSSCEILRAFSAWLRDQRFPTEPTIQLLERICPARNKALHTGKSASNIEELPALCRRAMELLMSAPGSEFMKVAP